MNPPDRVRRARAVAWLLVAPLLGCGGADESQTAPVRITFSGSAIGQEAELLRAQLARYMRENPNVAVVVQPTPDAADERHQLYVQWLNARVGQPDVLQLDVIWTTEFAAAGWILPLDLAPDPDAFFSATLDANRWDGRLYALPWFVDVGMLYWRTDLIERAPESLEELASMAVRARGASAVSHGFVWQGARYEGLVTVFLEILGGFGGEILDSAGSVAVADEPAVRALRWLASSLSDGWTPDAVLTWQEEQTRFAFQNGEAVFMRNWPYAHALLGDSAASAVAGRFEVAPMPASAASAQGLPTAALGGAQLAVNAHSRHADAALDVVRFLTEPEQMLERARTLGQLPSRPDLYDDPRLEGALAITPADARAIIERARPRPVTPVYAELSGILQIWLHRALTGQEEPSVALARAADEMRRLLERVGLASPGER
jgi:multiple sugar transport system substrate-binding protein